MKRTSSKPLSALETVSAKLAQDGKVETPSRASFREFLEKDARVRAGSGFVPYHFKGREAIGEIVDQIDDIFDRKLTDASLAICGGAQFGKTVLMLNLVSYLTAVQFRNVGYYLPDDDLVQGVVDGKFRPDVLDQIPWLADLVKVGKTVNASGKAVDRKGAFMCSDGTRTALGMFRGMGKIPTTFSMDVVIQDEKDDMPESRAKFLSGRMTASDLRFSLSIGTQRYHGAGQNKEFEEGTQHVGMLFPPDDRSYPGLNPEDHWPQVCRIAVDGIPKRTDPRLTYDGDFKFPNGKSIPFDPEAVYYLADPNTGAALDRSLVNFVARVPARIRERKFSYRISQLIIDAIGLKQIVAAWQSAVRDPEQMIVFCTDRLAMPKSTAQALSPAILDRSRAVTPFSMTLKPQPGAKRYAGVDTGDRCWFVAREVTPDGRKRLAWIEQMSPERARSRVTELCKLLQIGVLFGDIGAERALMREVVLQANGLIGYQFPRNVDDSQTIVFTGAARGLVWDGGKKLWRGLRGAAVEFTLKDSQGIRQKLGHDQDGRLYPIIACNRDETIQRVVDELLTPAEGLVEVGASGVARTEPSFLLPQRVPGSPEILETFDRHLLSGSRKVKGSDGKTQSFIDKVENHFLLATAYAALAEQIGTAAVQKSVPPESVELRARARKGVVL